MKPINTRRWSWIHKWSSLVCTVFMLLLCITGLPLIYHHEIVHALGNDVAAPEMAPDTPRADVDRVIAAGMAAYPGKSGQALKLLWALLDIATIAVLVTGLYLWLKRGKAAAAKPAEQRALEAA